MRDVRQGEAGMTWKVMDHEERKRRRGLIRRLFSEQNGLCFLCDRRMPKVGEHQKNRAKVTMEHVVPLSQGGEDSWENVVAAHSICNARKGGRSPTTAELEKLRLLKERHAGEE